MKVADGIAVRVARKTVRGMEVGRARASIVRERTTMVSGIKKDVVARCELADDKIVYRVESVATEINANGR